MLENFQSYLDKNYKLDLDMACVDILGKNFASLVQDYVANNSQKELENEREM